jgi:signal transduction histidine kinase
VNAFHHAHASHVEVEIEYGSEAMTLFVRDDGRGIEPQILTSGRPGHWGLQGMRDRAHQLGATLTLYSRPGAGTEIKLEIPTRIAFAQWAKSRWWRRLVVPRDNI